MSAKTLAAIRAREQRKIAPKLKPAVKAKAPKAVAEPVVDAPRWGAGEWTDETPAVIDSAEPA